MNKTMTTHKFMKFRSSFKNYAVDAYKNALRKINFPNFEYSKDVNRMYSDFFQKLMAFIKNGAPCKTKRVKEDTHNWLDGEELKNISCRK